MNKPDLQRINENLESIQSGFQKVLKEHGINSLTVSNFRLATSEAPTLAAGDGTGCWRWVCEATPSGPVCHMIWDPNC